MHRHYQMLADYNRWANAIVYQAAAALTDAELRAEKGAFFGSVHRTLNHLLVADRIWLSRMTGKGDAPKALDTILYEEFAGLWAARVAEDDRLATWIDTLTEEAIAAPFSYSPLTNPTIITHPVGMALAHLFNHQTHHRGQVHALLTALGKPSLTLDLIYFLRSEGLRWM